MNQFGLRFYTLLNILIICTIGMIFIGIVSLKITEQFSLQEKVESTKAIIEAFEATYLNNNDIEGGIKFLEDALEDGAWGAISFGTKKINFETPGSKVEERNFSQSLVNRVNLSRNWEMSVDGTTFLPFTTYKSYKIAIPIQSKSIKGTAFIYQPLIQFNEKIKLSQRLLITWIILFIFLIATFGYYLLSKTVVKPVQNLIKLTKKISKGIFLKDYEPGSIIEINQLQNALVDMSKEIEISKTKLEENIHNLERANREIVETQKQLIASEKMASLGSLSAGVAHEIGNPLSAINGYVEVIKKSSSLDSNQREDFLNKIQNEIDRINSIITSLLDYSKPKEPNITNVDANQIINESIEILKNQGLFKRIELSTNLSSSPLPIRVDSHQLMQVFINLLINSKDALNGTGKINIESKLEDNHSIWIKFSDSGRGIDQEHIEKIFDPFFTTKDPGQGTGLGLSISHRIIQQYDGNISVESNLGNGTEFTIVLPKSEVKNANSIVS